MGQFGELEAVIMHRLWTWDRRFALIPLLSALPPAVAALVLGRVQPA